MDDCIEHGRDLPLRTLLTPRPAELSSRLHPQADCHAGGVDVFTGEALHHLRLALQPGRQGGLLAVTSDLPQLLPHLPKREVYGLTQQGLAGLTLLLAQS